MNTLKRSRYFLSPFIDNTAPFNTLEGQQQASTLGFKSITKYLGNHKHIFDIEQAAGSQQYCDDVKSMLAEHNLQIR